MTNNTSGGTTASSLGKHPIQPIYRDKRGAYRFKENAIIVHLFQTGAIDLNQLAVLDFSQEDREQIAQLLGYPLSGFEELSYARPATCEAAWIMAEKGVSEEQARIQHLEGVLESVRNCLRTLEGA